MRIASRLSISERDFIIKQNLIAWLGWTIKAWATAYHTWLNFPWRILFLFLHHVLTLALVVFPQR